MDPSSVASNTARLLGLATQVTCALYGNWDEISRPTVDCLLYELARLRNVLSPLEEASQTVDVPIPPDQLVAIFRSLRVALLKLVSNVLGDLDAPQSLLDFAWEAYLPQDVMTKNRGPLSAPMPNAVPTYKSHIDRLRNDNGQNNGRKTNCQDCKLENNNVRA